MATKEFDIKGILYAKTGVVPVDNQTNQLEWFSWYKNDNAWRDYTITQNGTVCEYTRASLNSLSRVCRDWAAMIMNEPVEIHCNNSDDVLQELLKKKKFNALMNVSIEKDFALGGGALVWDLVKDDIQVQFVDATHCFPIDVVDGEVVGCAFLNQDIISGKTYNFINIRRNNVTENYVFDENGVELDVEAFNLLPRLETPEITFAFFTPRNLIRNDWNNPFGASVFADAIDANKMIDEAFDSFINEYRLGRKRIFVAQDLLTYKQTIDNTGATTTTPVFNYKDPVFTIVPTVGENQRQDITEVNMAIRVVEHTEGIQAGLNYLSSICGLGTDYYKYNDGAITTATQVISDNSELFRNVKKQQLNIDIAITQFVKSAMSLLGIDCGDVIITHDDSIIIDKNAQQLNDMQLVRDRLMSPVEFRMRNFGETKEMAEEMLALVPKESTPFENMDFNFNADTERDKEATPSDSQAI